MLKLSDDSLEAAKVSRIYPRRGLEQAFLKAFEDMGGTQKLQEWGSQPENYLEFLKLLTKFAPKEEVAERAGTVLEYRSNIPQSPLNRKEAPPESRPTRASMLEKMRVEDVEDGVIVDDE